MRKAITFDMQDDNHHWINRRLKRKILKSLKTNNHIFRNFTIKIRFYNDN